ncbi:DUF1659 domain-containing protein [Virgibacillus sp. C22-A2]|uniref:DUF1659 domain-containing protein n=1 Tax=Virgibacillus tibetensis TaxID=3042313 RepID=A0ABU6KGC4_9BACI|nr:DUF1659 domain-containing protein [Virgibacillus sp. C22-A2]
MAVADIMKSTLQLVFNDGVDSKTGLPAYKSKSFNNVKTSANADQLYAIANAVVSLQKLSLYNIHRRDSYDIRQG